MRNADEASGRILVRMPRQLHARLRDEARSEGVGLNTLIIVKLAMLIGVKTLDIESKGQSDER